MKTFALAIFLGLTVISNAQFVNINPDPNGDPWWVFAGEDSLCFDRDLCIDHSPLILTSESLNKELPYMVDNSEKKYFRPVFHQGAQVCAAAAKIGYIFTYEINRIRDSSAEDSLNLYPHYYEANYYNWWGEDSTFTDWGSLPTTVELIKKNGIPNLIDFGGIMIDTNYHWVNGYEKWERAMHNRTINEWEIITLNEDSLFKLKHYINDHAIGDSTGGLAQITADFTNSNFIQELTSPSQCPGKKLLLDSERLIWQYIQFQLLVIMTV